MLRRPFQSRPPCIRGVGRQASSHARNQKFRVTAVQALAHSLVVHGLTGGAKSAQNLLDRKTIQIIDPRTRQEVTIDLQTVQPFTPEFALLPLRYRTAVERRHLLATLRERQKTAYEVESPEENDNDKLKPDDELVKKYISEFLKRRRATTDTPPSDSKINQYIEAAKEKALKEGRERISTRKAQDPSEDEISFEEQWNRRQTYGMTSSHLTNGRRKYYQAFDTSVNSSLQPYPGFEESCQATKCHHRATASRRKPYRAQQIFLSSRHETIHIWSPRQYTYHQSGLHLSSSSKSVHHSPGSNFPSGNNLDHRHKERSQAYPDKCYGEDGRVYVVQKMDSRDADKRPKCVVQGLRPG